MKAISELKVPYPKADRINSLVRLDPEELGARLGSLEIEGYVQTKSEADLEGYCLPNGHHFSWADQSRQTCFIWAEMVAW